MVKAGIATCLEACCALVACPQPSNCRSIHQRLKPSHGRKLEASSRPWWHSRCCLCRRVRNESFLDSVELHGVDELFQAWKHEGVLASRIAEVVQVDETRSWDVAPRRMSPAPYRWLCSQRSSDPGRFWVWASAAGRLCLRIRVTSLRLCLTRSKERAWLSYYN